MNKEEFKRDFGLRLRAKREAMNITQQELADRLGYSKSFISKVESGKNEIPQSKVILAADVLQTTIAYLMGWNIDMDQRTGLSEEERQLISYYRSMNLAGRTALIATARGLAESGAYTEDTPSVDVG